MARTYKRDSRGRFAGGGGSSRGGGRKLTWWQKAARDRVKKQAQAILDAYSTLADLRDRSVGESEMLAAALRETINQCQDSRGMFSAPELLRVAAQLDVVEDDIDLFQAQ